MKDAYSEQVRESASVCWSCIGFVLTIGSVVYTFAKALNWI